MSSEVSLSPEVAITTGSTTSGTSVASSSAGDRFDDRPVLQHAGLDGIDADIVEDSAHLALDDIRRHIVNARDAEGVLDGDGGDGRRGVSAERGDRLDIRLDAGAAAQNPIPPR